MHVAASTPTHSHKVAPAHPHRAKAPSVPVAKPAARERVGGEEASQTPAAAAHKVDLYA
jgi:hypothetical protein